MMMRGDSVGIAIPARRAGGRDRLEREEVVIKKGYSLCRLYLLMISTRTGMICDGDVVLVAME